MPNIPASFKTKPVIASPNPSIAADAMRGKMKRMDTENHATRFRAALKKNTPAEREESASSQKTGQKTDTDPKDASDTEWRRREKPEKKKSPGDRIIDNFHAQTEARTTEVQAPLETQATTATQEGVTQYVQKVCDRILLSQGDGANTVSMRFTLSQGTLPDTNLAVQRLPDGSMQFAFETENPESMAFLKAHTEALTQHIEKSAQVSVAINLNGQDADAQHTRFDEREGGGQHQEEENTETDEEEDV